MEEPPFRARLERAHRELRRAEGLRSDALNQVQAALIDADRHVAVDDAAGLTGVPLDLAHRLVGDSSHRAPNRSWRLRSDRVGTCWHLA